MGPTTGWFVTEGKTLRIHWRDTSSYGVVRASPKFKGFFRRRHARRWAERMGIAVND